MSLDTPKLSLKLLRPQSQWLKWLAEEVLSDVLIARWAMGQAFSRFWLILSSF